MLINIQKESYSAELQKVNTVNPYSMGNVGFLFVDLQKDSIWNVSTSKYICLFLSIRVYMFVLRYTLKTSNLISIYPKRRSDIIKWK